MDISVDFRTTEWVSITQEGNLIHDRLFMKISVDDRSRMDESLYRIYKLRQTRVNKPFNINTEMATRTYSNSSAIKR